MNSHHWHNPLRDPRDKRLPRIAGPSGLTIFGVTGDLSRKKLMPAIYDLANRGLLPPGFALTGFARRDWENQDFMQVVYEAVKEHARTPFHQSVWDRLAEGMVAIGDAESVAAHVKRHLDAGADHVVVQALGDGHSADPLPALRELAPALGLG